MPFRAFYLGPRLRRLDTRLAFERHLIRFFIVQDEQLANCEPLQPSLTYGSDRQHIMYNMQTRCNVQHIQRTVQPEPKLPTGATANTTPRLS